MRFEWDEEKRQATLAERHIDFLDVTRVFDGRPAYTFASPQQGEERFVTVASLERRFFAVVWTWRGEGTVRIISARRARHGEERAYRQLHG